MAIVIAQNETNYAEPVWSPVDWYADWVRRMCELDETGWESGAMHCSGEDYDGASPL